MKYRHQYTGEIDRSTVNIGDLRNWNMIEYSLRDFDIMHNTKTNDMKNTRKPKFEVFQGEDEQWYFHLCAPNGEIICQSEGYVAKSGALNGIESIKLNAPIAKVMVEME